MEGKTEVLFLMLLVSSGEMIGDITKNLKLIPWYFFLHNINCKSDLEVSVIDCVCYCIWNVIESFSVRDLCFRNTHTLCKKWKHIHCNN